jgi:hypothetical protein
MSGMPTIFFRGPIPSRPCYRLLGRDVVAHDNWCGSERSLCQSNCLAGLAQAPCEAMGDAAGSNALLLLGEEL